MALRIVSEDGNGYNAKIYDVATGKDVTAEMRVTHIDISVGPNKANEAVITTFMPQLDITVEDAMIRRVCPCCGREIEKK